MLVVITSLPLVIAWGWEGIDEKIVDEWLKKKKKKKKKR
jgi:hypothetical protein